MQPSVKNMASSGLKFGVTDLDGVLRGKQISAHKFKKAQTQGLGFCNVLFGWDSHDQTYATPSFGGWQSGFPDAYATIDLATERKIPWQDDLPFYLADFSKDAAAAICPRSLLKRVIAQATAMGLQPLCAFEYEWFNFAESPNSLADKDGLAPRPISPGMFGYSLQRIGQQDAFFSGLWEQLHAFGIEMEGMHTETGPGVYEAALAYTDPLEAADRAALFKYAVKEIAHQHGFMASFMAKWRSDLPGCGGHFHQSMVSSKELDDFLFYDQKQPHQMSEMLQHYLAGQLYCLPRILPMFAPTVNSYKRLVPGSWAATSACWGVENRTAALRVINPTPAAMRLETRVPGADANPYLVAAAAIAAGLYGIGRKLPLDTAAVTGNAYESSQHEALASNLHAATTQMQANKALCDELFGSPFTEHFIYTRQWEWQAYEKAVTDWELKRYFELV